MSKLFFIMCLSFSFFFSGVCVASAEEANQSYEDTITSPEGSFQVKIDSREKRVEVVQAQPGKPGHLRLRILRQAKKPLEVRLHVAEKPEDPFRYTGKADPWNGSMIGFELEWSFDKKTWKKLGKSLNKFLP